jgi:hypothetical protein
MRGKFFVDTFGGFHRDNLHLFDKKSKAGLRIRGMELDIDYCIIVFKYLGT